MIIGTTAWKNGGAWMGGGDVIGWIVMAADSFSNCIELLG